FVVIYYLVIGCATAHLVRYFTALVPVLCVLLAALVLRVAAYFPKAQTAMITAGVVALLAQPVRSAVMHNRIAGETDTRVLAAAWMREHLPPDAFVAVIGSRVFVYADPELPPGVRR